MKPFETKDYKAFTMFEDRWALVTAGTLEDFNTCTVSWGSMGNVWGAEWRRHVYGDGVHPSSSLYAGIHGKIRYLYSEFLP